MTPTDTLLQTTVFGDLARERIAALLPAVRTVCLARGQLAFGEGDPADALFVVAEGQLKGSRGARRAGHLFQLGRRDAPSREDIQTDRCRE